MSEVKYIENCHVFVFGGSFADANSKAVVINCKQVTVRLSKQEFVLEAVAFCDKVEADKYYEFIMRHSDRLNFRICKNNELVNSGIVERTLLTVMYDDDITHIHFIGAVKDEGNTVDKKDM